LKYYQVFEITDVQSFHYFEFSELEHLQLHMHEAFQVTKQIIKELQFHRMKTLILELRHIQDCLFLLFFPTVSFSLSIRYFYFFPLSIRSFFQLYKKDIVLLVLNVPAVEKIGLSRIELPLIHEYCQRSKHLVLLFMVGGCVEAFHSTSVLNKSFERVIFDVT